MTREHDAEANNIDTILQNLAKRPNVRSTLILSRKDGSIIKASGFIADDTPKNSQHNRGYSITETAAATDLSSKTDQAPSDEAPEPKIPEEAMSPSQVLAESIYTLVTSAVTLAETLGKNDITGSTFVGQPGTGRTTQEKESSSASGISSQMDNDIQLLRVRLKKQEVIVFPDAKYLCCVVQDLGSNVR